MMKTMVVMKTWCRSLMFAGLVLCIVMGVGGCTERDPDEGVALRRVPVMRAQSALTRAIRQDRTAIVTSLQRTLRWYDSHASQNRYPWDSPSITHTQAQGSVARLLALLESNDDPRRTVLRILHEFDLFESTGRDNDHSVLFTAYYAPEYRASRTRSDVYRYPIYATPAPLRQDASLVWRTRTEIEDQDLLAGTELMWLASVMDVYFLHINGSARLRLPDGSTVHVGVSITNNRPYTSIGRLLIDGGHAPGAGMSMQTIRAIHERDPATVEALIRQNDRYVFFHEIPAHAWPRSAIGVALEGHASVATDRSLFPAGMPMLVSTNRPVAAIGARYDRLMVDQDTGGAIKSPGRADLFFGVGDAAGEMAGRFMAEGRMWYLVHKADAELMGRR